LSTLEFFSYSYSINNFRIEKGDKPMQPKTIAEGIAAIIK
jgi:hypothetical protein